MSEMKHFPTKIVKVGKSFYFAILYVAIKVKRLEHVMLQNIDIISRTTVFRLVSLVRCCLLTHFLSANCSCRATGLEIVCMTSIRSTFGFRAVHVCGTLQHTSCSATSSTACPSLVYTVIYRCTIKRDSKW